MLINGHPFNPSEYQNEMAERQQHWYQAGADAWLLTKGALLWPPILVAPFFVPIFLYQNAKPERKVIALVCERLIAPVFFLYLLALIGQVGVCFLCLAFDQVFVHPDLRLTGLIRAFAALLIFYIPLSCLWLLALLFLFAETAKAVALNLTLIRAAFYWRFQRRYSLSYSSGIDPAGGQFDLVAFSDLHVPATPNNTIEAGGDDERTEHFVRHLSSFTEIKHAIMAGDMTDAGDALSMERVAAMIQSFRVGISAVPGNHDLQVRRIGSSTVPVEPKPTQQPSSNSRSDEDENHRARVHEFLNRVNESPLPALQVDDHLPCDILLLDSNVRISLSPISNAIGSVGAIQRNKARKLLSARKADRPLVIVLHHHIAPPTTRLRTGMANYFLACLDSSAILDMAMQYRAVAIIHGHLHMPYVARIVCRRSAHQLAVVSCGSARFSAKGPFSKEVVGPSAYGLSFGADGCRVALIAPPIGN